MSQLKVNNSSTFFYIREFIVQCGKTLIIWERLIFMDFSFRLKKSSMKNLLFYYLFGPTFGPLICWFLSVNSYLLVYSPNAYSTRDWREVGSCCFPTWVAGTQSLEHCLLSLRFHLSWNLEARSRGRVKFRHW